MRWNNVRPTASASLFIGVAVLLLVVLFAKPVSSPFIGYGIGYIDWPGAVGVAPLGVGLISVGVLYLVGGVAGMVFERTSRGGFRPALLVSFLGFLALFVTYWGYREVGLSLQPGWQLDFYPWSFLGLAPFSYAPILLAIPLRYASRPWQELLVLFLGAGSAVVPAAFWWVVADWGYLAPFVWMAVVVYDGVLAYPLYRFAK